jgi:SAM-dependent methyltransferase
MEGKILVDLFAKLKEAFPKQYPRWRVCFENAKLTYQLEPRGSISLPDLDYVIEFKEFIDRHVPIDKRILDVGCGSLPLPGYLTDRIPELVHGVDVIDYSDSFAGKFHHAPAEFLPHHDGTFDAVTVGTSLDHTINLNKAFSEIHRVLKRCGCAVIWTHHWTPEYRFRQWFHLVFRLKRYMEFPPHTIFYVPPLAPDPFHHKYRTLGKILRTAKRNGFVLLFKQENDLGHVFLYLQKGREK